MQPHPITVAYGDGIGPEIMRAVLRVLDAAGAALAPEVIEIGEQIYRQGETAGIREEAWESIRRTRVFLKAPVTTPPGSGFKNLNVTIRKSLGLYANIRPCISFHPFIPSRHPLLDVVIIRENEEDLYGGIEHRQTTDVTQCLKLISRPGCEKIIRYAFEYAQHNNRKKVSAFTKDKVMEFTDGFFHQIFREIAQDYPEIDYEHQSLDTGTARLTESPQDYDVIVIPNLYGDILSDVVAQITTGSKGLAGSANLGDQGVMFEAMHGSAPGLADQDLANPSGLLLAAVMMLVHIGQRTVAQELHNALLRTLEDGYHTVDIYREGLSQQRLGTQAFADAVIARLGQVPQTLAVIAYPPEPITALHEAFQYQVKAVDKFLVGVDLFLDWRSEDAEALAESMLALSDSNLHLQLITNLGVIVWPNGFAETRRTDRWHCRFLHPQAEPVTHAMIVSLLERVEQAEYDFIKIENLYQIDQQASYSH